MKSTWYGSDWGRRFGAYQLTEKEIEAEATIQRSLVVGDYASAVDACLAVHRMADALMLASLGGAELWSKAQKAFMDSEPRPYMKVRRLNDCSRAREAVAILTCGAGLQGKTLGGCFLRCGVSTRRVL